MLNQTDFQSWVVYHNEYCKYWKMWAIWTIRGHFQTRRVDDTPTSEVTRSISGRSLHLTLVTKWSQSWSWMTYSNPFVQCQSALPFWDKVTSKYDHENPWSRPCVCGQGSRSHLTLKIQGQGHDQGQIWLLHLRPIVQLICFLFVSWQSDHFWLRHSKFKISPWKFKVMAKVNHFWGLEIKRYVCLLFGGNPTIFGWDMANSIFDLEKSMSMSWLSSNSMVTFEA